MDGAGPENINPLCGQGFGGGCGGEYEPYGLNGVIIIEIDNYE